MAEKVTEVNGEVQHYQRRVEKLSSGINNLLGCIDDIHEQNVKMTEHLDGLYAELDKLRELESHQE